MLIIPIKILFKIWMGKKTKYKLKVVNKVIVKNL